MISLDGWGARAARTALLALLLPLTAQAQPSWSGLAGASDEAPAFQLAARVGVQGEALTHWIELAVVGSSADLARVSKVEYRLLPAPLDPTSWLNGDADAEVPGTRTVEVEVPGDLVAGNGFAYSENLIWLPSQVVARVHRNDGTSERIGPFELELADPMLRVAMKAEYKVKPTATDKGLKYLPTIESLRFQFAAHPDRPADRRLAEVAVALGRAGEPMGVFPTFQRFPVEVLRENKGRLHIGTLASRRGLPSLGVGDARDFIWVVAIDESGAAESYATWRLRTLPEDLPADAKLESEAPEELHPFTRIEAEDPR